MLICFALRYAMHTSHSLSQCILGLFFCPLRVRFTSIDSLPCHYLITCMFHPLKPVYLDDEIVHRLSDLCLGLSWCGLNVISNMDVMFNGSIDAAAVIDWAVMAEDVAPVGAEQCTCTPPALSSSVRLFKGLQHKPPCLPPSRVASQRVRWDRLVRSEMREICNSQYVTSRQTACFFCWS